MCVRFKFLETVMDKIPKYRFREIEIITVILFDGEFNIKKYTRQTRYIIPIIIIHMK